MKGYICSRVIKKIPRQYVAVRRIKHSKNEIVRFEMIYLIDISFGFAVFIIFDFKNRMFNCHRAPQRQKHNVIEAHLIFS